MCAIREQKYGSIALCVFAIIALYPILASGNDCDGTKCHCSTESGIAHCSRKQLPFIPEGIPGNTALFYLNDNNFENTTLQRANFSAFKNLEQLYLSSCGIEFIQVDTFADLVKLKWLDISGNRLRNIEDFTFRGLVLNQLFLNDNPGVKLADNALAGFQTSGLNLKSCAISKLSINLIKPLNGTLRTLRLDGNDIEALDKEWLYVFRTLGHLRMGHNQFHCNCELSWLWEFYNSNPTIFASSDPPSCKSPARLGGKGFNDMTVGDLSCDLPVFQNADININILTGTLSCSAKGDPTPSVTWINPHGKSMVFPPTLDETVHVTSGVLTISRPPRTASLQERYVCVAGNPAGNVSLTLNVTWPPLVQISREIEKEREYITALGADPHRASPSNDDSIIQTMDSGEQRVYKGHRDDAQYTLVQIVSAIIGTFLMTLLVCILLFHFYYKHQAHLLFRDPNDREKSPDNVYVTSDIDEQTLKMMNHHNHHNHLREQPGLV